MDANQQSMFTLAPAFVSIILYSRMSLFPTILYSILLISINLLLKKERCWNIPAMQALLGSVVTNKIMFLHAIYGCDTTSGVYGLGKKL